MKIKGKVYSRKYREVSEREYGSTLSLILTMDGAGDQCHYPVAIYPGKTRYPFLEDWVHSRVRRDGGLKGRPTPVFDPRTIQLVANRYNDYICPSDVILPIPTFNYWAG